MSSASRYPEYQAHREEKINTSALKMPVATGRIFQKLLSFYSALGCNPQGPMKGRKQLREVDSERSQICLHRSTPTLLCATVLSTRRAWQAQVFLSSYFPGHAKSKLLVSGQCPCKELLTGRSGKAAWRQTLSIFFLNGTKVRKRQKDFSAP